MKKPFIIGTSGIVRSGKNTFCDLLQDEFGKRFNLNSVQVSLAWQLRKDLEEFGLKHGFDVWTQKNEDKEDIRPLMLWWGTFQRKRTKGQYFINCLKKQIESLIDTYGLFLVTDCRFKEFNYDESDYIKENGVLVHVSRYDLIGGERVFNTPPNEFEARNDPIMKQEANYIVEWENSNGDINKLKPHITKFVDWLENKEILKIPCLT